MEKTGLEWHELPRGREDLRVLKASYYEADDRAGTGGAAERAQAFLEDVFAEQLEPTMAAEPIESWVESAGAGYGRSRPGWEDAEGRKPPATKRDAQDVASCAAVVS
eukprot:5599972-Pleurochrysis_carterae.AAC.1